MSTTDPAPIPATPSRTEQNELLKRHSGLIRKAARRYATTIEFDDCLQVARIAFVNSLPKYNPDRGALAAYLWFQMTSHLHAAVQAERRRSADSLDEPDTTTGEPRLDSIRSQSPLPDEYTARRERRNILQEVVQRLPERMRDVVQARFEDDMTLAETSERIHRTKQRVAQIQIQALAALAPLIPSDLRPPPARPKTPQPCT